MLFGALPKRPPAMHRCHVLSQIHEAFATVVAFGTMVAAFLLVDELVPVKDSRMRGGKVAHVATKDFAEVLLPM